MVAKIGALADCHAAMRRKYEHAASQGRFYVETRRRPERYGRIGVSMPWRRRQFVRMCRDAIGRGAEAVVCDEPVRFDALAVLVPSLPPCVEDIKRELPRLGSVLSLPSLLHGFRSTSVGFF